MSRGKGDDEDERTYKDTIREDPPSEHLLEAYSHAVQNMHICRLLHT